MSASRRVRSTRRSVECGGWFPIRPRWMDSWGSDVSSNVSTSINDRFGRGEEACRRARAPDTHGYDFVRPRLARVLLDARSV